MKWLCPTWEWKVISVCLIGFSSSGKVWNAILQCDRNVIWCWGAYLRHNNSGKVFCTVKHQFHKQIGVFWDPNWDITQSGSTLSIRLTNYWFQRPNPGKLPPHFKTFATNFLEICLSKTAVCENYIFHEPSLTWFNYSEILFEESVLIFTLTLCSVFYNLSK